MSRPEWDDVWMAVAKTVAERSLCTRAQVGAVIVTADNRVQSVSYNGPAPAFAHGGRPCTEWCPRSVKGSVVLNPVYDDCVAGHAEANAIVRADWSMLMGATLYVTGSVCFNCAKLIGQTGIRRVVHIVNETDAHRRPEDIEAFLGSIGKRVERAQAS